MAEPIAPVRGARLQRDAELPGLVEGLIRLQEFSREAPYLPLAELVGERAMYVIPARDLPLLRGLREHYVERRLHSAGVGE